VNQLDLDQKDVFVQQFVDNPLLIDGRKFDLGVYTVVTSLSPLRVYIYEGDILLRFCPEPYQPFDSKILDKYVVGDDYTPIWEVLIM
jgi:tubulin monoglycylase TTLL15